MDDQALERRLVPVAGAVEGRFDRCETVRFGWRVVVVALAAAERLGNRRPYATARTSGTIDSRGDGAMAEVLLSSTSAPGRRRARW